ncbi:MAG: sulfur carrier protein ThiS [SAR324 cluster bacterium]|nr:sulfur carrier protein ThiS [SAR324 cluster bacterium]
MRSVFLNGQKHEVPAHFTLHQLLKTLPLVSLEHGIAVCVNDEVIPRKNWSGCQLQDQDRIDVVHATQGG